MDSSSAVRLTGPADLEAPHLDHAVDGDVGPVAAPAAGASCPFDHTLLAKLAPACPVDHSGAPRPVQRSKADLVVRRLLRVRERPQGVSEAAAYGAFQRSMLISATRCTLTYVVFPFVLPAVGIAARVGPLLGIVIGLVAMTCDVFTVRRFFQVDHRYRWHFSAIATCVIGLLSVLLVQDVVHLLT